MDFGEITGPLYIIRAIGAFILVFFVPGFAWTLVFFKKINFIERIVLAIGLSIALVTLTIIVMNIIFDMRINGFNALITIIVLTLIPTGIFLIKRFVIRKSQASGGE